MRRTDVDGAVRTEPLMVRYYDKLFPSLSLMAGGEKPESQNRRYPGQAGRGSAARQAADHAPIRNCACTRFSTATATASRHFRWIRFTTCYSGKIPAAKYQRQDRADRRHRRRPRHGRRSRRFRPAVAPVLTLAHTVSSILKEDFFVRPAWAAVGRETGVPAGGGLSDRAVAAAQARAWRAVISAVDLRGADCSRISR